MKLSNGGREEEEEKKLLRAHSCFSLPYSSSSFDSFLPIFSPPLRPPSLKLPGVSSSLVSVSKGIFFLLLSLWAVTQELHVHSASERHSVQNTKPNYFYFRFFLLLHILHCSVLDSYRVNLILPLCYQFIINLLIASSIHLPFSASFFFIVFHFCFLFFSLSFLLLIFFNFSVCSIFILHHNS